VTTEVSEIREQLQSLLVALERREQDAASRRIPRPPRSSSDRDSQSEPPDPRIGQPIWQLEEVSP
jgi:hypothetical protein